MRKDIIKNKIIEIQESLLLIRNNLPDSFNEFQHLWLIKDGIYKRLEFSIENLVDIFYIIIISSFIVIKFLNCTSKNIVYLLIFIVEYLPFNTLNLMYKGRSWNICISKISFTLDSMFNRNSFRSLWIPL